MLKVPGDTAIPTLKADLYARYLEWKTRTLPPLVPDAEPATPLPPLPTRIVDTVAASPLTPLHAAAPPVETIPIYNTPPPHTSSIQAPSLPSGFASLVAYAAAATPFAPTGALDTTADIDRRSAMGELSEDKN